MGLVFMEKYQVTILDMPWQLSCPGIYKIVSLLCHYKYKKLEKRNYYMISGVRS